MYIYPYIFTFSSSETLEDQMRVTIEDLLNHQ